MKITTRRFRNIALISLIGAAAPVALAQSVWTGANNAVDLNWSDAGNWSGGAPASGSTVTFNNGAFPLTTNVQGAVNNIVSASQAIASLTYNNQSTAFITTEIPSGTTLTISGGLSVGASDGASINSVVTMTGGGSLIAGTSGTATLSGQNGSGQGSVSLLDLSGLNTFVFNNGASSPGSVNLGTGGSGSSITVNLAATSNNITCSTLNIGNNNTRGANILNLGNGTNIIKADTIEMAYAKASGTMQFLNNAGGGLNIANHTGTGRAAIHVGGQNNSGSTTAVNTGLMLFNGGTVNILASTLTIGDRGNRSSGSAVGALSFNNGAVNATAIYMSTNTTGASAPAATLSVGGPGMLIIGSGGLSLVDNGGTAGTGTLIVTNSGTVTCSGAIYKTTGTGVGTVWLANAGLSLTSITGTIGVSNGIPIDEVDVTNSVLNVPIGETPTIEAINFNPDTATTNTINVNFLPPVTSIPSQFQVITYQTAGGGVTNMVLGTLPGIFQGYLSNNTASSSIDLVITNGPVAQAVEWGGGVNNLWDTTTTNWTNSGVAVTYNDLDFVTFDDLGQTSTVSLPSARVPGTWTNNNNVLNYTFTGAGKISGVVGLVQNGTATTTLAETGGDNFSGGIALNAGTLVLDDANCAISGGATIAAGTTLQIGSNDSNGALPTGTLDLEGVLIFKHTNNVTVGVDIPGGGALTQVGSGVLSLSAANGYTGPTTVSAGTLALTNSGAIAGSSAVNVTGATLDVSGASAAISLQALNMTNSTLNVTVGYLETNLNVASLGLGGTTNTISVRRLPAIAFYPATLTLVRSASAISGYNFGLSSLPAATPAYAGSIAESADQSSVLLTLSAGPTNTRPSVTWSGADAANDGVTNWSDALNWQSPGTPTAAEPVVFNNTDPAGGSPFSAQGDGSGGVVTPDNINNAVNLSVTNASLNYANTAGRYHNTLIGSGKTLTLNGSLTVNGSGGNVTILGSGGSLKINNPANATSFTVANATAPTLDLSGLDTLSATVNQMNIGASSICYLARTNLITTGSGYSGSGSALVVSGSGIGTSAQLYLGQTNAIYVDGIVLGIGESFDNLMTFNPALNSNPVAYLRGVSGPSSRITQWSLGDFTVNLNNNGPGLNQVVDFSSGTLNALVNTLIVGQGPQSNISTNNEANGIFNMGAGTLDVTTLEIGATGSSPGGSTAAGILNVTGGTVIANTLQMCVKGGAEGIGTATTGSLNLTNGTLVLSNGITLGVGSTGSTLSESASTINLVTGAIGTASAPLTTLNLNSGAFQLNVDANAGAPNIDATTINTNGTTTINLSSIANVSGPVQIPLISYTGVDPFGALAVGASPAGYSVSLIDDTNNSSIDLSIAPSLLNVPHITLITVVGPTLSLKGTNGTPNHSYVLLGSTNVTTPFVQWKPLLTNSFAPDGSFNLTTNIINPALSRQFFILSQ